MQQEERCDHQDDERRSEEEEGEWRRDDPQDHWNGHGKDTDDKHGPRCDHRTTFIGEVRRALHQVGVMSEWERWSVPHRNSFTLQGRLTAGSLLPCTSELATVQLRQ